MNKKLRQLVLGVMAVLIVFFGAVLPVKAAAPPLLINYQGKLIDSTTNLPVTSAVSMTVLIYDALNGGNVVYSAGGTVASPSAISVTPNNGNFTLGLGDGSVTNAIDPTVFQGNQNLYLEIRVGSDTLTPRHQVVASPYAFNAKYLNGVGTSAAPSSSTYIPVSDSSGNFSFNRLTINSLVVTGTSTLATTTINGNLTVNQDLIAKAVKDALGTYQNQQDSARAQTGYNGGSGSQASTQPTTMTSTQVSFFDAASWLGMTSPRYGGVIFDGRYLYYTPSTQGSNSFFNLITRFDTTQPFTATSSWTYFDTNQNLGINGIFNKHAVFDGRYVYFNKGSLVVRYDTSADFANPSSWRTFDMTTVNASITGFFDMAYDGSKLYFVDITPTTPIIQYDPSQDFSSAASYTSFLPSIKPSDLYYLGGVFDGKYLYFLSGYTSSGALGSGKILRYNTTAPFSSDSSWNIVDTANFNPLEKGYVSANFDGRYIYFISEYGATTGVLSGQVTRYDTTGALTTTSSWSTFNTTNLNANSKGFFAAVFDGRYLYLVPNLICTCGIGSGGTRSGQITRFDSAGGFNATSSWSFYDLAQINPMAKGFNSGVFDGHYIYFAPFGNNDNSINAPFVRISAYTGGVDVPNNASKLARGSDFFIDSSGKVGIGTTEPVSLLTLYSNNTSTLGLTIATNNVTSTFDHNLGLLIASSTANPSGLFRVDEYTGNTSVSGTLRVFGGSSNLSLFASSTPTTNTLQFSNPDNTTGRGIVFDTNLKITSSTAALYSWRNNGFKLMSLSASGTLDVYGGISAMNTVLGTPGTPGDLSERVDVRNDQFDSLEPGDIMTMSLGSGDTYQKTLGVGAEPIMGVIASNPTLTLGNGKTEFTKVVTFLGRTPVKVSLQNGAIKEGDALTLAPNEPGKAMKLTTPGPIVGYALEDLSEINELNHGLVLTLVRPGWSGGSDSVSLGADQGFLNLIIEALKNLGIAIVDGAWQVGQLAAQKIESLFITTSKLCLDNECITEDQLKNLLDKNGVQSLTPDQVKDGVVNTSSTIPTSPAPEMVTTTPIISTTTIEVDVASSTPTSTPPEVAPTSTPEQAIIFTSSTPLEATSSTP